MNITDYQVMQSLNVTPLTSVHLEKPFHKLPSSSMVIYSSSKEQIQQIDENYPFTIPTWLIILITVLGTLMNATCTAAYCYYKYRKPRINPRPFLLLGTEMILKIKKKFNLCSSIHLNNLETIPK